MSDPAAILATFAGFKQPIIGRRVVPLVFEVPIEKFQEALKVLGTPDAASPKWCGIALTNLKPAAGVAPTTAAKPNRHIRRFMALANDRGFWNYLRRVKGKVVLDEAQSVAALKSLCGIISREELVADSPASETLAEIAGTFNNWMRQCPATGPAPKPSWSASSA